MHMNTFNTGSVGMLTRMAALIGLTAALAGCGGGDTGSSGSPSSSSTASASTATPLATPVAKTPVAASTTTSTTPAATAATPAPAAPVAQTESVTLAWAAPTENTDGSALTNLAGFDIYYGTSASALTQKVAINSVGLLTYVVENLPAGTWYFEVVAINATGVQSGPSSVVSLTI
jgi:hypothetical protein